MTNLLALFSEFERKMIRRRMEEGWQEAYEEGRVGRTSKLNKTQKQIIATRREMGYSYEEIITFTNKVKDKQVSKPTVYRVLNEKDLVDEQ